MGRTAHLLLHFAVNTHIGTYFLSGYGNFPKLLPRFTPGTNTPTIYSLHIIYIILFHFVKQFKEKFSKKAPDFDVYQF